MLRLTWSASPGIWAPKISIYAMLMLQCAAEKNVKKIQNVLSPSSDYSDYISDLGSWKSALENTLKRWPLNSLTIWHLLDSNNCSEVALIANRPQSLQLRMSAEIWGQSDHQEYSRIICCWKTNGLEINLRDTFHVYPILLQSGSCRNSDGIPLCIPAHP